MEKENDHVLLGKCLYEVKGSFNVRVSPELHKQAVICAASHQMTLNSFVEGAMRQALASAN